MNYILIKKYPNSPKVGFVVKWGNHGLSGDCYEGKENKTIFRFAKEEVENNTEYWKEEEFEILEVFYSEGDIKPLVLPFFDIDNNLNFKGRKYSIYSVRRTKDDTEFRVGDKIKNVAYQNDVPYPIQKIEINHNGNCVLYTKFYAPNGLYIQNAKKANILLFNSSDDIEIYVWDYCFGVDINSMLSTGKYMWKTKKEFELFDKTNKKNNSHIKLFSTIEASEKFLNDNEKKFSKLELIQFGDYISKRQYTTELLEYNFKEWLKRLK